MNRMGNSEHERRDLMLKQIDAVLTDYDRPVKSSGASSEFEARALAVVERIAPGTAFERHCKAQLDRTSSFTAMVKADGMMGVLRALRVDVQSGYLRSITELIHAELFGDFLDMAEHQLEQGYKQPAAVIAGCSLEQHLREMSQKAGIDLQEDGHRPKKADTLNNELKAKEVYEKLDHKSVMTWLDLRNKAAHPGSDKYDETQVKAMIDWLRYFIAKYPA